MNDICKACGRLEDLHKASTKETHHWPRIMCSGGVDLKWVRRPT